MQQYVHEAHRWAFDLDRWGGRVWQDLQVGGRDAGSAQHLVVLTQSPSFPGPCFGVGAREIWNQAWFSSLRTASGLFRWARRHGDARAGKQARLAKALALAAPMHDGLFPAVLRLEGTPERACDVADWADARWTNSDRAPTDRGITRDWYHVADASWTALTMLRWFRDLEADPALVQYARAYAEKLLTLQDTRGFFPGWLHPVTLAPGGVLDDSPETSVSVTFLLELAALTGDARYRAAARAAMDAVLGGPLRDGRWEDFETYWSSSSFGAQTHVGRRFARNGIYKQNTLSMFWTAEALLASWRATGEPKYLAWGRRTLDELSMFQQVWQPPFIHVPALGGFGVMNADGEWNDARQSLFAELFMDYYVATGEAILFERAIASLKAAFVMMYTPLNPHTRTQWERAHPFLSPADYGFTMENYAHDGFAADDGTGIGFFALFDWAAGGASEAFCRIVDHYGHVYVDRARQRGFGIDSIDVVVAPGRVTLVDRAGRPRLVDVVFDDGTRRTVWLDRTTTL